MNKELEEAIEILKEISTDDLLNCWTGGGKEYNAIQVVLKALENSIPKEKIESKIKEIKNRIKYLRVEIDKTLKENEAGTETEIDLNEQYIWNMEIELEKLEYEENILKELLEEK